MKFAIIALSLALAAVACNKKEETAPAVEAAPAVQVAPEGHDKEHQHVSGTVDHAHEDAHHAEHDHAAHHPDHAPAAPAAQ